MLLPPDNFGIVEEGIYRCSKLDAINFSFVETLQLKMIVILNNESQVMKNFQNFMRMNHIKSVKFENESINTEIGDQNNTDWMVFPAEVIQNVLKILLNRNSYNILIIDKTNVIIGLLRKICKWNYSSIISEYRLFTGKNSNYFAETFLELASLQLVPDYRNRRESIDHVSLLNEKKSTEIVDVDDDEIDDSMLSGSPQVPKSLLKMVEIRKKKNHRSNNSSLYDIYQNGTEHSGFYRTTPEFNTDPIKVPLPSENDLPDWFKLQRDMWAAENQ